LVDVGFEPRRDGRGAEAWGPDSDRVTLITAASM
jgi:hypothetical protein